MKTNSFYKTTLFPLCLIAFMVLLVFTSCQKDPLGELTTSGLDALDAQSPLALEKLILEINFQMPTEGMSNTQILQLYSEMTGHLSEEDRNRLVETAQTALAQEYQNIPGQVISNRTTESMLTIGIPNDEFGATVATVGNKVYVGAYFIQKVFEYAKTGGTYSVINEITPDPAWPGFGSAVSVSGSWMAIGAPRSALNGGGKVFMYKKQGNAWVQKAILTGPPGSENFGPRNGLELHGNTLVANSRIPGPASTTTSTISVFTLSGNDWTLQQEIVQPLRNHACVRLDASENRIATGTGLGNMFGLPRSLIFVRDESSWTLEEEVIINLPGFGAARHVAIDGNNLVILPVFPGTRNLLITNNGGDWELSQELVTPPGAPFTFYFAQIEGQKIIIGAPAFNNAIPDAVHVFENLGASWDLTETLTPSDLGVNVWMSSLALEGNTIVAGCFSVPGFPGKAYVFE